MSNWKTRGVPDDVLARVVRETGASFQYLDTGEGDLFASEAGQGGEINPAKLFEAWDFLGKVEEMRMQSFTQKQRIELLAFIYNVRVRGKTLAG